jgi:hypothetical protein
VGRSEIIWPQVNGNYSDAAISVGSGFALGYMYDVGMQVASMDASVDRSINFKSKRWYWSVLWKAGLGAAAGMVMDLRAADRANSEIGLTNTGWGAIGGLTSVVIHF